MKKILTALIATSAIGLTSASAFTVITGSVIEFTSPDDLLFDSGTSVIAVDMFGNGDSTVNNVQFFTDRAGLGAGVTAEGIVSSGGVTVTTPLRNQIDNWSTAITGPAFTGGTPGSAPALSEIMRDIRWANAVDPAGNTTLQVDVTGLAPNSLYNVQLLFNEGATLRDRRFDIGVNGALAVDDFSTYGGNGAWSADNSYAYSGNFDSGAGGVLNIELGQEPLPGDPNNTAFGGLDNNSILQAVVIHEIPEPGSTALFGIGLFALIARRRRR